MAINMGVQGMRQSVRSVTVLGSTGSIGCNTVDLLERDPERFPVEALVANRNVEKLAEQARRLRPRFAAVADESAYGALKEALFGSNIEVSAGPQAVIEAAARPADWVMAAIVGAAGLSSTLAAAAAGKRILLANKESLVLAGELLTRTAEGAGAEIIPIDSEHSAIFQCLRSRNASIDGAGVRRILLTASGGPFRGRSRAELAQVTPAQAVAHPKWSMGPKISVDSATLMNKGLEVIEAHHLFAVPGERIEVLVHPQSLVHSLVEFVDGSTLAQMGLPDMRTTLAVGLGWPQRIESGVAGLDLLAQGRLDFEAPDTDAFPCLTLAWQAMQAGGTAPAVLNAANQEAVSAFLQGRIGFLTIPELVANALSTLPTQAADTLEVLLSADQRARQLTLNAIAAA